RLQAKARPKNAFMRGKNTKISDSLDIKNALTLKTLQFYFG
ncbi:MAG: hypothetical protein RLZZ96_1649, partial [Bacteroidota bacterium]